MFYIYLSKVWGGGLKPAPPAPPRIPLRGPCSGSGSGSGSGGSSGTIYVPIHEVDGDHTADQEPRRHWVLDYHIA